ncbi:hypothetical protein DIPPA_05005 [Diplonema papillatum]|nr:hypothetical protein DIPPA_06645 [Diplonema papillatum]KAJ9440459.1 hypothetical protein DIPPA_05005 [Diplonema papillatum]
MLQLADELTVSPTCDQRLQGRTLWALVNPESREAAARQLGGTVMASIRVQKVKAALTKLARSAFLTSMGGFLTNVAACSLSMLTKAATFSECIPCVIGMQKASQKHSGRMARTPAPSRARRATPFAAARTVQASPAQCTLATRCDPHVARRAPLGPPATCGPAQRRTTQVPRQSAGYAHLAERDQKWSQTRSSACGGGVAGAGGGGGASTCSGGSGVAGAGGGSARRTLLRASPPASPGFRLEQAGGGEGGAGAGGGGVSGADRGDQYNHF